jgi:CheY-like chemotaxis protein
VSADEGARRDDEPVATAEIPAPHADLSNVRVLIVEDDRDSLELVSVVLERAGAQVVAAPSPHEALAARGAFDVIISDIGMPEMDGYTMIQRIRAQGSSGQDIPAIALTAYVAAEDADRARRAGFQEHLSKPIEAAKLVDAVQRWSRSTAESKLPG